MTIMFITWEILCVALFWTIFCRCVRTNHTTKLQVRFAFYGVGLGALLGIGAPLYGWEPDFVNLFIVGSIVFSQIVMAKYWRNGVPHQFVKSRFLDDNKESLL